MNYSIAKQLEALDNSGPALHRATTDIGQANGQVAAPPKASDGSEDSVGLNKVPHVDTQNIGESGDSELAGLHPSPQRMSSRRHEHIAGKYQDMASGRAKLDENETAGPSADTQLRRAASTISQKPAQ